MIDASHTRPQSFLRAVTQVALRVAKPGQYLGGEVNSIRKDWQPRHVSFALAFPDQYSIGMSNQGFKILYHLVNEFDSMVCERAFAPQVDMEAIMRAKGIPAFTLENHYPLHAFDAVGFSLQNETSYSNLVNLLDLGGIPMESANRDRQHPIVIAGGTGSVTPEPLADFIDLFLIGEGEEILPVFLHLLACWRNKMTPEELRATLASHAGNDRRKELLAPPPLGLALEHLPADMAGLDRRGFIEVCAKVLPGCYAPSLYTVSFEGDAISAFTPAPGVPARVKKSAVANLNDTYYPTRQIIPFIETVHDRVTVEIMRGCTEGCRYCQAGMIDRPQRYRTPQRVLELAQQTLRNTGYDEVALLSLSSSDHPQLADMIRLLQAEFAGRNINVSLPSLRVNQQLAELPRLARDVRKGGLTMAPESGSERLRRVINKNISQQDLIEGARAAFSQGWKTIKFYLMMGLPTETEQDMLETAHLLNTVGQLARDMRKHVKINVTISIFVPKAFTPFQWEPMLDRETVERHKQTLRSHVRFGSIRLKFNEYDESWLEAIFSRGDRRLGKVIQRAWQLGARFDAWKEQSNTAIWERALSECGLRAEAFTTRERGMNEILPWDVISVGVNKRTLWFERVRSRLERTTQDCSGHTPGCLACGVDPLTCRTGIDQPQDDMRAEYRKRPAVRYAEAFKARQAEQAELTRVAPEHFRT